MSQDFCPRSQPPFASPPLALPSHSPCTRLSVTQPFCYTFLQCALLRFLFLFFGLRFSLLFVFPSFSAFWGQAFPSRQKNPNMFTRDLWRGIFVYVAFLRRRLRLFRRLCFASGSPRLRQVYLGNSFQKQQLKRLQMEVCRAEPGIAIISYNQTTTDCFKRNL